MRSVQARRAGRVQCRWRAQRRRDARCRRGLR